MPLFLVVTVTEGISARRDIYSQFQSLIQLNQSPRYAVCEIYLLA